MAISVITEQYVRDGLRELGLARHPVCLHSSLRSFGAVEGGPATIVQAFLAEGCTLMVPTYSYWAWTCAPDVSQLRPSRNAFDYDREIEPPARPYTTASRDVSGSMGSVAAAVCEWPGRVRGSNPGVSCSAVGPVARELIEGQSVRDPNAPFRALAALGGFVVLAGVGLNRMSLLHAAEELSGRTPFMRYALIPEGVVAFATGGCSEGFDRLASVMEPFQRESFVRRSRWRMFPAAEILHAAASAIHEDPSITHCDDSGCESCDAATAGGPILTVPWEGLTILRHGNQPTSSSDRG